MDNKYPPPSGDPQDRWPTEQFWPMNSPAAGNQDPYGPGPGDQPRSAPGAREHFARDRRKALHWTIGITVAAILAGGGIIAGLTLSGNSGYVASGPAGQAAALNATLSSADSPAVLSSTPSASATPSAAAGSTAAAKHPCAAAAAAARAAGRTGAAKVIAARCRGARLRIARLLGGVDGQFTFRTKTGFRTLAYERGVIESVTGGSNIVVRAANGTTWTWDLVAATVVRENGAKTAATALATGQAVWVGGPVNSGAKDARLIVIRPAAASSPAAPSATPSASAS
jgi:hypothetical protein